MTIGANPGSDPMLEIRKAGDLLRGAQEHLALAHQAVRRLDPMPAQTPTEEQIVAALKADPAMAGRVMVALAYGWPEMSRQEASKAAHDACRAPGVSDGARVCLQSLAVALAAASYRG